jgi:hypothetical protein
MLDSDLAKLYQVTTGNLNLAVKRNPGALPRRFHVPDEDGGSRGFAIAICKIKERPWRPADVSPCIYRTRGRDVVVRAQ